MLFVYSFFSYIFTIFVAESQGITNGRTAAYHITKARAVGTGGNLAPSC